MDVVDNFTTPSNIELSKRTLTRQERARFAIAQGHAIENLGLNDPLVRERSVRDYFASQEEYTPQSVAAGA